MFNTNTTEALERFAAAAMRLEEYSGDFLDEDFSGLFSEDSVTSTIGPATVYADGKTDLVGALRMMREGRGRFHIAFVRSVRVTERTNDGFRRLATVKLRLFRAKPEDDGTSDKELGELAEEINVICDKLKSRRAASRLAHKQFKRRLAAA